MHRHGSRTYRTALRLLGNRQDAEDIAQEALIAGWQQIAGFRGQSSFSTWMYRIVTRKALNRTQRTRPTDSLDLLSHVATAEEPGAAVERNYAVDAVTDAVSRLSPAERIVIVLHHFEGLSYAEVADITHSTVAGVRSHLYRARRTLALQLREWR